MPPNSCKKTKLLINLQNEKPKIPNYITSFVRSTTKKKSIKNEIKNRIKVMQNSEETNETPGFINDLNYYQAQLKAIDVLQLAKNRLELNCFDKISSVVEKKQVERQFKKEIKNENILYPKCISEESFESTIQEDSGKKQKQISACALRCKNYNQLWDAIRKEKFKSKIDKKKLKPQNSPIQNQKITISKLNQERNEMISQRALSMKQQKENICDACSFIYDISRQSAKIALRNLPELTKFSMNSPLMNSPARSYIEKAQKTILNRAKQLKIDKMHFKANIKSLTPNERKKFNIITEFEQHQENQKIFKQACRSVSSVQLKKNLPKQQPVKEIYKSMPFYKYNTDIEKQAEKKYSALVKQFDVNVLGARINSAPSIRTVLRMPSSTVLRMPSSIITATTPSKQQLQSQRSFKFKKSDSVQIKTERIRNLELQTKFSNFLEDIQLEQEKKENFRKFKKFKNGFALLAHRLRAKNRNKKQEQKININIKKDMIKEHSNALVISKFSNKIANGIYVK